MALTAHKVERRLRWWSRAAVAGGLICLASLGAAVAYQRSADRPVGEGSALHAEALSAAELFAEVSAGGVTDDEAVRHVRNHFSLLGVYLVDDSGGISAASSNGQIGSQLETGVLRFGLVQGVFAAVASPLSAPLFLDGVQVRAAGDVVYEALYPIGNGSALVMVHDLQDLLRRRSSAEGLQRTSFELGAVALLGLFVAVAGLRTRARVAARLREVQLLRSHTEELDARNRELDDARAAAQRALAMASEKSRIRTEFVLMINHELRTPLTSIVTGSDLLRSNGLGGAERDGVLDDLSNDAHRLETMIAEMLNVASIENRGLDSTLRPVSLDAVFGDLGASFPDLRTGPAAGVRVLSDHSVLVQVVSSLVDNGYTHGAGEVSVQISRDQPAEPMEEVGSLPTFPVFVSVSDDGPGIDPAFLPRVFEKFEKLSGSAGTGLGLYMARLMVEALDGWLAVSTSSRGTVFMVALPQVQVGAAVAL